MPGCKPSFKKAAGGGKRIGAAVVTVGADGRDIHNETACFGGNSMPIMNARPAAAPPVKSAARGTRSSGGMFG